MITPQSQRLTLSLSLLLSHNFSPLLFLVRFTVSAEQITYLQETGMSLKNIASCLGISERTLYRKRVELGVEMRKFTEITDVSLERIIRLILSRTPNAGETYVKGSLRSRGINIPRRRLRHQLNLIDPIGRGLRRRKSITT